MKRRDKILFLTTVVISLFISGCYTVLWTPEEELPNESNYQPETSYYIDDYYYYYDYPWWLTINSPATNGNEVKYERDRDKNISTIRNTGEGRGTENTRRDILTPPPPTIDNNSNGNQNTEVRKTTSSGTSSNTSNAGANNSGRQSSSSNSNSTRNNDGGRNNGGGRR